MIYNMAAVLNVSAVRFHKHKLQNRMKSVCPN